MPFGSLIFPQVSEKKHARLPREENILFKTQSQFSVYCEPCVLCQEPRRKSPCVLLPSLGEWLRAELWAQDNAVSCRLSRRVFINLMMSWCLFYGTLTLGKAIFKSPWTRKFMSSASNSEETMFLSEAHQRRD